MESTRTRFPPPPPPARRHRRTNELVLSADTERLFQTGSRVPKIEQRAHSRLSRAVSQELTD